MKTLIHIAQRSFFQYFAITVLMTLVLFVFCKLPTDPNNPTNSDVHLILKSSSGSTGKDIYDSLGKDIKIIAAFNYPAFIKTTTLQILSESGSVRFDTNIISFSKNYCDTVSFTKTLIWPDKNKVVITSHVENGAIKSDSASVLVFYKENRQPEFSIEGNLTITPEQTCSLRVIVSDPDKDQKHTIVAKNGEESNVLESNLYIWKPTDGFTGTKDIIFKVTDNGNPILSKEQKVTITVLGNAPHWDIQDTMKVKLSAGLTYTLKLRDTCTDARDSNLAFTLLPGKPDNDTIDNGNYRFASTESDTGKYLVTIIAKNKFGQADTLFLQLVLMYIPAIKDTIPPVLRRYYPLTDSISVSAAEVAIKVVCKDSDGIGAVTGTLVTNQFTATKTDDTLYTIVVSKLPADKYSMVTITASDKSGNSSSIKVFIKYDPSMVDNTKPILTPVNPLNTNIKKANTSVDIQISCKDESGISSVICQKNGSPVEIKNQDPLYSATITGLISGKTDTVRFIAFDNSSVKNCDTLIYLITCDQTLNDTTGPDIRFITPSKDSVKISSSTLSIEVRCTDISGISSVTAEFGTSTVTATKETNNTYKANITGIATGNSVITITATDSSTNANVSTKRINVHYDPSLTDSAGPEIQLKTPAKDNDTIGSSSLNVEVLCKDISGIASVTCSSGTTAFPVSKGAGDIYSASVSELKSGKNEIKFTALDSSANFNKGEKIISIIYDSTMGDNVAPQVSLKNPAVNGQRVFQDTITVTIACKDDNRIGSVSCKLAKKDIVVGKSADSLYSARIFGLTKAGLDTITFTVTDASKNKNSRVFHVIIKYNTLIGAITALTPEDKKNAVELQPSFTWDGGDDPDGETVYFKVVYGTTESSLTKETGEVKESPAKITTNLAFNTTFYWQVVAFSKTNSDVSKSKIMKFTTLDEAPKITKQPENISVKAGQTATFKVTATGTNLSYQWQKGTTDLTDAKDAEYTTGATVDSDNGSTFRCVISNNAGKMTSNNATLSILHGITYNANGATSGNVPTEDNFYSNGVSIKVKDNNDLKLDGHTFLGWARSSNGGSDKIYKENDTLKFGNANITLYARWKINTYKVTFDKDNGSSNTDTTVIHNTKVLKPSDPDKNGYKFNGWFNGSTIWDFNAPVANNLSLTAHWVVTFKITYYGNAHTNGNPPSDYNKYEYNETAITKTNSGNLLKTGYVFKGWNTQVDGKGTIYGINKEIIITQNISLYADWIVVDKDNNVYTTVKIGNQVWLVENLKTTKYNDSSDIPDFNGYNETGAFFWFKDDPHNYKDRYGALYNWYAVKNGKLAPEGWRVPTDKDWNDLSDYLGGASVAGGKMKATKLWHEPNVGATDSSGFTALPGGYRDYLGGFHADGTEGYWWSSTVSASGTPYSATINSGGSSLDISENNTYNGYSVRLIRTY